MIITRIVKKRAPDEIWGHLKNYLNYEVRLGLKTL